jgi:bacterioferritin (cytochrome b1)
MTGIPTDAPVGASEWERGLFNHLTSHVERERSLLEEYATAADQTDSKAFAYLVRLLVDEERHHHQLFLALASSLKTDAELSGEDPAIPYMDFNRADHERIRQLSRQLLEREADDAKDLKQLHKEMRDVADTTLWDLLVNLMRRDTDKHIAILEFVLDHTPK